MNNVITLTKLQQIAAIMKDPDRKPLFQIFYELFYLLLIYRELPVHYFSKYLFKKETKNIKNYLPNKLILKIPSYFNYQKVKQVLDNKLYFDLFYSQFDISMPEILMYNHRDMYVVDKKWFVVNSVSRFADLLNGIFKNHAGYDSIMIKKAYASSSGNKIFKLFQSQVRNDPTAISEIFSEVSESEFLFQATIKQHPELDRLNSSCLNTIRIDTFINIDGSIDILSAYIRVSFKNSHLDNISMGGCMIGVDIQTGCLMKFGYSKLKINGVKVMTEHPITKTIFENLSVPFFNEVKELVLKAASYMPELRLVGWDVGIGESGPVLIEGNSDYGINANDLTYGGYLGNAAFRKVLHEYKYL